MANSSQTFSSDELNTILGQVEEVFTDLKKTDQISNSDREKLGQVISHIDNLLIHLKRQKAIHYSLLYEDIIKYLTETNQHLRKVFLQATSGEGNHNERTSNDKMFLSLVTNIKKLTSR